VDNFSYQEKSSNHKGEKIPIVLFPNTVIKPLQNPSKSFRSGNMIYQPISKEKTNQIVILCNDDQSDQHTCHKLYSACCT